MQRTNKSCAEIIYGEMTELATLVMKYSRRQLANMISMVDLDLLQHDMCTGGATEEELMAASECHHDICELISWLRYPD